MQGQGLTFQGQGLILPRPRAAAEFGLKAKAKAYHHCSEYYMLELYSNPRKPAFISTF